MTRINDLEDVLDRVRLSAARDVNVALPATVVAYNAVQQRATIRISVYSTDTQGRKRAYPDLQDIPVWFPSASKSALTFPLNVGDTGLYIIANHSLENWLFSKTTDPVNIEDNRVHDIQDGIFYPGSQPFDLAVNSPTKHTLSHSTDDLVLVHNLGTGNEAEVRITPTGAIKATGKTEVKMVVGSNSIKIDTSEIKLTFGSSTIVMDSSGIKINGTLVELN